MKKNKSNYILIEKENKEYIIKAIGVSSSGRTTDSGSVNSGSNPFTPAIKIKS